MVGPVGCALRVLINPGQVTAGRHPAAILLRRLTEQAAMTETAVIPDSPPRMDLLDDVQPVRLLQSRLICRPKLGNSPQILPLSSQDVSPSLVATGRLKGPPIKKPVRLIAKTDEASDHLGAGAQ
jgi:hypothetical protein